ncbi:MAG TPA: transglutaminase family protein [Chthoniobacterales bacterium]
MSQQNSAPEMHSAHANAIIGHVKFGIRYMTAYRYDRAVTFSPHEVRLFPRNDRSYQIQRLDFRTQPATTVRFHRDLFDNVVAGCFFANPSSALELKVALELEVAAKNPFDFILAPEAVELPFAYAAEVEPLVRAYRTRQTADTIQLPGWKAPTADSRRRTVDSMVELTRALHQGIAYERREEGPARSPAETLRQMRGACRDVSVLLAEMLRELGLAARLVSGYLREADDQVRRAEGSLHAWTEVFLPGAGWVGLDPTNGIFCNHNFIATAVGLSPADITPISGSFYHRDRVPAEMTSRLEMLNL